MRNKTALLAAAAGTLFATATVAADAVYATASQAEGPFMMRLRGVYLDFAQKSDALTVDGVDIPADAITLNKKWIPDIDLEWFWTPNISTELVLTYPQKQDVTVAVPGVGDINIGSFKHLPPTLTVKYNFLPGEDFRPYAGIGINVTFFSDVNLTVPAVGANPAIPLDMSSSSVGFAAQVGMDYKVADHWFLNADVKWVQIGADVKAGGATITKVKADPWLFGLGVGYRF